MQYNGDHLCGGVIIDKCHVLTAAHCVSGFTASNFSIYVGTTDLQKPYSEHRIESTYIHENYDLYFLVNDIALLKLQPPLKFSYLVSPVNLPEQNETVEVGSVAVVSGYGVISPDGNVTTRLYVVDNIITNETFCRETFENEFNVTIDYNTQICANHPTVQQGACAGDSGGPLTVNKKLVGLVSFGYGLCTSVEYPGVYTRVSAYIDWINEKKDERYF
ncbi:Trypsin-1 [Cyphomyrmex costatus]|uniref:Trypsin-1 n=2 Tax=Cyphomyrmex costatus TaxID=456900 RepID=A0A151IJE1_9HYME|nr:Trypsin-1 [Cyphomyrmex costatus]